MFLFWLIPILKGFHLSLQSDTLFDEPVFIGLGHYRDLLSDPRFFHALRNTFYYAAMTIVLVTAFSLALAHLLRRAYAGFRGPVLFCLMLPGLTPPAVLAFLYLLVFNGPHGMLNGLLAAPFGLPMVDWIRDPRVIKFSLVLLTLWRWSGFTTLILLSGMEGIPKAYYDLARAEGAGPWQSFRHVTLPMLSHVLAFTAVFLFLDAFVLFEGAYILLGGSGGTLDAGLLLVAYTYQTAFTFGKFGTAAAMGFSMVPLLMGIVWLLLLRGGNPGGRNRAPAPEAGIRPVAGGTLA
ncbi:MAG TPA: sugar ABC transporter permease [Fibrobacteria bacterium]|nr:sugar ABC transporter permease [Fibrobacteria bacterium]